MNFKAKYYDKPEGQDAFGKMIATNRYAIVGGLLFSTTEIVLASKPKGYYRILARYLFWTAPLVGMASAFTMGTYTMTNMRKKDDKINYVIGGLCAGGVYGSWRGSVMSGISAGLMLAVVAYVKKVSRIEGWEFFPEVRHQLGTLRGVRHDFTLMKGPEKGWTDKKKPC